MKKTIAVSTFILCVFVSASSIAQTQQCDWWGRTLYPICENKDTGWGNEDGQKCISADACVNDQPADRGGLVNDETNPEDDTDTTPSPVITYGDQCNTTPPCQAIFGNEATDCLNSRTDSSVCMCG